MSDEKKSLGVQGRSGRIVINTMTSSNLSDALKAALSSPKEPSANSGAKAPGQPSQNETPSETPEQK